MDALKAIWSSERNGNERLRRTLSFVLKSVRLPLYGLLAVLRPFVVLALTAFCVVDLLLCLFFGLLVPGSHFPLVLVFGLSVVSALGIIVYYALMDLLLPE
jgi:hypothetical protein